MEINTPFRSFEAAPIAAQAPFDTDMDVLSATLQTEVNELKSQAEDLATRLERSDQLLLRQHRAMMEGHAWLDEGQLVRRGIANRYGGLPRDLYQAEQRAAKELNRRKRQLDKAEQDSTILQYADETDLSQYDRYLSQPGQCGANFNLPPTLQPSAEPSQNAEVLRTLPFIPYEGIVKPERTQPRVLLDGSIDFPLERIVSCSGFESWAGRGDGIGKVFEPVNIAGIEQTSIGAITDYAQTEIPRDPPSGLQITILRDAAGEYWGAAKTEGSHRIAAAKLRGEATVPATGISITADEDMPWVGFSVRDVFSDE